MGHCNALYGCDMVNGYSIAARLCQYFCRTLLTFPQLCKVFGPLYWEHLTVLEKLYFKRLALHYQNSPTGRSEWYGYPVNGNKFVAAIFGQRREELNRVKEALKIVGEKISTMTNNELIALYENNYCCDEPGSCGFLYVL